jgi:hypothetical protein
MMARFIACSVLLIGTCIGNTASGQGVALGPDGHPAQQFLVCFTLFATKIKAVVEVRQPTNEEDSSRSENG